MEKKKFDVEFHGTNLFALVPLLLFVVFCILFFVVFKTFDMMHLCMGGYVALIIGSLLSKNWGKYWDAVATGMSSKIMNELALILLIVGMFGKLMTRGGVAQGFVWLGDKIGLSGGGFVAFTFIATCVIATATGTSIGTMFTAFPILYPSGLLLGADPVFLAGAILSGAINEAPTKTIPHFNFQVPTALPGVDPAILDPRDTYADASQWEEKAKDLASRFVKNFVKYESNEHGKALVAAGPKV